MLKWLRKYSRSWFIALAIGAIVVVFIFWGIGGLKSQRFQEAAMVNGAPILMTTFIQRYNQVLRETQERAKGELSDEDLKLLKLKEQTLNLLIEETLIQQGAASLGLTVTTSELQEHIRRLPYFQDEGHFSLPRYQGLLARAHLSPADFESQERQSMLTQRFIQTITAFAKVSDGELREIFRLAREEMEVNYLMVPADRFVASQNPTEADLAAYYKEHQKEFRTPDRVRVRYILFKPGDFADQASPSPQELSAYLKEHGEEFTRPKLIHAREIFLAAPPNMPAAKRQEVEKKARNLLTQAARGQIDFERLAQALTEDPQGRSNGGDLGDVKRGAHPPAWDKVAFSLRSGEVGLAQTDKGFHLIKVEEVKETETLPEAEVRTQAGERLKEDKARLLAQEAAQKARGEVSGDNFPEVARKFKAQVRETPFFAVTEYLPDQPTSRPFNEAALGLNPQEVSRVVELPQGFAVIQCLARQPAATPPLEQVKAAVRSAVARQQAKGAAEKEAKALLEKLRQGEPLAQVAAKAGLPVNDSGFFSRSQGFLKQPLAEALTTAAFQLSSAKPYSAAVPPAWKDTYYLLAFKAHREPSPEEFKKEEEPLRKAYLEQKRQILFKAWLSQEIQRSKIVTYELPS